MGTSFVDSRSGLKSIINNMCQNSVWFANGSVKISSITSFHMCQLSKFFKSYFIVGMVIPGVWFKILIYIGPIIQMDHEGLITLRKNEKDLKPNGKNKIICGNNRLQHIHCISLHYTRTFSVILLNELKTKQQKQNHMWQ